jgi:hypothetical protein
MDDDKQQFSVYDDAVHIDYLIYGQFIKYNKLTLLSQKELSQYPSDKIYNIYIDLYQVLLPIYRYYRFNNVLSITSCIVNLAIHFRNFYRKYGVYTNIFLIYSPNMSYNNTRFCPEYNNRNITKVMNNPTVSEAVSKNMELLSTIVPYLPDIYLKIGTVEPTVIAADMISRFASKGFNPPSIFVSNSQYAFQLPLHAPKSVVFFKKKDKEYNDLSYSVNIFNALDTYIAETRKQSVQSIGLNQRWLTGFMTLAGMPKRDIKSLMNYKSSISILKTIASGYEVISPEILYETISRTMGDKIKITMLDIANRYNCLDLGYQMQMYSLMPEAQETTYLKQLHDPDTVNSINGQYFQENPIMIDKL